MSLGLRPLEPSPETTTNLISLVESPPALQNQTFGPVPALPPGLNPNSFENDVDHHHLPPPTTPSLLPHHSEPEEAPIPSTSISQSFTPSPAGFTKLINTIRRAPSISGTRVSNGGRSVVEKSPRPSLTIPPHGESLQEQPPPMPPLPPSILNRSNSRLNSTPMPNVQVTDPKKEKEKEKSKSTGGWFKRKSVRVVDRSRSESAVPDSHPSPAIKSDKRHWHTPSTGNLASPVPIPSSSSPNTTLTDLIGHRPDHSRSEKSERDRNSKINGYFRKSPHEPVSPFVASPYFIDAPSTSTRSSHTHSRSSTLLSDVGSSAQLDSPPSRKPSLSDRYRSSVDRKKSIDSKPHTPSSPSGRPMTAPSSSSPNRASDYNTRSLPPLPPTPKTSSHRPNLSLNNSQSFYMDSQNTVKGKTKFSDMDNSSASVNSRSISISESPASIAASVGQNSSVGSTNSAALSIKHKLSLGFKKRKEKDPERDKGLSSSTFNRF